MIPSQLYLYRDRPTNPSQLVQFSLVERRDTTLQPVKFDVRAGPGRVVITASTKAKPSSWLEKSARGFSSGKVRQAPFPSNGRWKIPITRCISADMISLGLERTDNGMKLTSWPDVTPINQKNYYTCVVIDATRMSPG